MHFPFSAEGTWLKSFPPPRAAHANRNLPETVCTLCGIAGLGKSSKDRFTLGQAWKGKNGKEIKDTPCKTSKRHIGYIYDKLKYIGNIKTNLNWRHCRFQYKVVSMLGVRSGASASCSVQFAQGRYIQTRRVGVPRRGQRISGMSLAANVRRLL